MRLRLLAALRCVGVKRGPAVLGALHKHSLLALRAGEVPGLLRLGVGAADLQFRCRPVLVERRLLDDVRSLCRELACRDLGAASIRATSVSRLTRATYCAPGALI